MAGVSKISELEARKRALVTESELCREAFRTEIDNLHSHATSFFHKFDRIRSVGPWVMLAGPVALPLLSMLFRGRKKEAPQAPRAKGVIATALIAFRLYRKYWPLVKSTVSQFRSRRRATREARSPAANI